MVTRDVFQLELEKRSVVQATTDPLTGVISLLGPNGEVLDATILRAGGYAGNADTGVSYIANGLVLPTYGALTANPITAGAAHISSVRVSTGAYSPTLVASKDNYIDFGILGFTTTAVTIGAAAPSVAINSIRIGYIRTGSSTITSAVQTGKDSLGNWMSNRVAIPVCQLRATPSASISGNVVFGAGTEVFDNSIMHSVSTNSSRITVPQTGFYEVRGAVNWAAGSNLSALTIYKNGTDASLFSGTLNAASTVISASAGGFAYLNAGDYLELNITGAVYTYAAYLDVLGVR